MQLELQNITVNYREDCGSLYEGTKFKYGDKVELNGVMYWVRKWTPQCRYLDGGSIPYWVELTLHPVERIVYETRSV